MSRPRRDPAPPPPLPSGDLWPALTASASLVYLGLVAWVVIARVAYPYELEWLEGIVLQHVARVRAGLPLYAPPTLEFVSLNYPPLYYWLSAAASAAFGHGFFALRLVSLLSAVVAFALLWTLVRFETGRRAPAWLAAGLFAAMFRLGGAWLDVARADSLQLALVLAGVTVARVDRSRWRMPCVAAALFAAGFLAKQSAAATVAPLMLWLVATDRRRGLVLAAMFAALVAISVVLLDSTSDGWFRYHAFTVPGFLAADPKLRMAFPLDDLLRPFWPLIVLGAIAAWRSSPRPPPRAVGFHLSLALGCVGLAWTLRGYRGGYANVLMPAHAAVAMLGALAFARLTSNPSPATRVRLERYAACALAGIQLALLAWNPARQVPRRADRVAGDQLVEQLRQTPGRVWVSSHGYLATLAGLESYGAVTIADGVHTPEEFMTLARSGHAPGEVRLLPMVRDSLRAHAWQALLLDNRDWLMDEATAAGYRPVGRVFRSGEVFWPVTGFRTRPDWVFAPGGFDSAAAGASPEAREP